MKRFLPPSLICSLVLAPAATAAYPVHTKAGKTHRCSTTEKRSMSYNFQMSGSVRVQCRWMRSTQVVRHNNSTAWSRVCSWDSARGYFKKYGWTKWIRILGKPSCSLVYTP